MATTTAADPPTRVGDQPKRFGLYAWLVAAIAAVGVLASIAVALVILPTLEESIRADLASQTGADLLLDLKAAQAIETATAEAEMQALANTVGGTVRLWVRDPALRQYVPARGPAGLLPADTLSGSAQFVADGRGPRKYDRVDIGGRPYIQAGYEARIDERQDALLEASVPVRGIDTRVGVFRRRVLLATGLVLVLACLAGLGIARLLGSRIRALAGTALTLASGDLSARAVDTSPQELTTLSESLNAMASRLESLVAETVSDRDRARALVGSLSEGVLAVTDRGEVTVANAAAQRLLGVGSNARSVQLAELPDPVQDAVQRANRGAFPDEPVEATLPGGIEVRMSVAFLTRGGGVVVTMRDVTDERRLARARRDLIANVSHELKTPLTAIKGFMELLENTDLAPDRRAQFVDLMSQEVARLERLVAEQLELARLDAGALSLGLQTLDLGALAIDVTESRRLLAEREQIELVARAGPDPVLVEADPARVEQILLILLDNAVKHTPADGKITVGVAVDDQFGTLSVRDTGAGIPYEAQPFIFDRFYQADTSREGQGLGLGLAIARGLADAHGGSIDVHSAPLVGTVFTVRLPLASAHGTVTMAGPPTAPAS